MKHLANTCFPRLNQFQFQFSDAVLGKAKCVLNCATTEGDTTTFGNVKDGTPCTDKPNSGVCINGQCEVTILISKFLIWLERGRR